MFESLKGVMRCRTSGLRAKKDLVDGVVVSFE